MLILNCDIKKLLKLYSSMFLQKNKPENKNTLIKTIVFSREIIFYPTK